MEPVKFQTLIQDAFNGKAAHVSNAQRDGSSTPMDTANQSVINALHGKAVATVLPAMEDMSYLRALVLPTPLLLMDPATSSALSGKVFHVLNVPKEPSSIKTGSVSPSILNAKLGILSMETAFHAMVDISYLLMQDASNHPSKPLPMPAALVGLPISKPASNAQTDSSLIPMVNAKKYPIFVLPGTGRMDFA